MTRFSPSLRLILYGVIATVSGFGMLPLKNMATFAWLQIILGPLATALGIFYFFYNRSETPPSVEAKFFDYAKHVFDDRSEAPPPDVNDSLKSKNSQMPE